MFKPEFEKVLKDKKLSNVDKAKYLNVSLSTIIRWRNKIGIINKNNNNQRFTKQERKQIADMYFAGKSYKEIKAEINVSESHIYFIADEIYQKSVQNNKR